MLKILVILFFMMGANTAYAVDLTITIPENVKDRVFNAFADKYNYEESDGTKQQFALSILKTYITDVVKSSEADSAANTARDNAIADVDTDINL